MGARNYADYGLSRPIIVTQPSSPLAGITAEVVRGAATGISSAKRMLFYAFCLAMISVASLSFTAGIKMSSFFGEGSPKNEQRLDKRGAKRLQVSKHPGVFDESEPSGLAEIPEPAPEQEVTRPRQAPPSPRKRGDEEEDIMKLLRREPL